MKITNSPDIQLVAEELEEWAGEIGWKSIAARVAQFRSDFHKSANTLAGLQNISQVIRRAFRGRTQYYQEQAAELTPAILSAMPTERRARVVMPDSLELSLAFVCKRFSSFATAALLDPESIDAEIDELISSLIAFQQLSSSTKGQGGSVCLSNY